MTTEQEIDLAMSRVKDKELRKALDGLHMALHRRAHRTMAKQAQGYRFMEMSQHEVEEEWVRR